MALFSLAIPKLLHNEGSAFVQRVSTGEVSKYGITAFTLRDLGLIPGGLPRDKPKTKPTPASLIEIEFVKGITEPYATDFYRKYFWDRHHFGDLTNQELANKAFDLCVNSPGPSGEAFQRAVNRLTFPECPLKEDGDIGPLTISWANSCDPVKLLEEFRAEMSKKYALIAEKDPDKTSDLPAWLDRLQRA